MMETKNSAQVQANIPNASLSSYEPVKISLADAPSAEAEQLEGYKRRPRRRGRLFLQCSSIRRSLSSSTSE